MSIFCLLLILVFSVVASAQDGSTLPPRLAATEKQRVKVIEKCSASTVCIFSTDGLGGGSGVLIDSSGYALSNFHVVDPCGVHMYCGLNDGKVYDAVVVGVDPVGDLALIKILGRNDFPAATLGNSDQIRVGQSCFAAGNPFLLANDFTPTISWGIVSGKNRYQYPAGTLLEYADCIQTDAAINPGNSGGPLFDAQGILIGINGRGSFEKRGRVNVGVGYAISVNQVRHFLGSLKSGRVLDHATPGFVASSSADQSVRVSRIDDESDAFRQGIRYDTEILNVGGRQIKTVNDLKNIIGTYPAHWCVPMRIQQDDVQKEILVRLESFHAPEDLLRKISRPVESVQPSRKNQEIPAAIDARFEQRRGYSNFHFARQHTQTILEGIEKKYNPAGLVNPQIQWSAKSRLDPVSFVMNRGKSGIKIGQETGTLAGELPFENQTVPARSGGFLNAVQIFQELVYGDRAKLAITYYGTSRFVSPLKQTTTDSTLTDEWLKRPLVNVLRVIRDGTESWVYVDDDFQIISIEYFPFPNSFPAVVEFKGRIKSPDVETYAPKQVTASYRNQPFVTFQIDQVKIVPSAGLATDDKIQKVQK